IRRSFSMSSSPQQRHYVDVTVKREEGGLLSPWLCDELKSGDSIQVQAPYGHFTFTGTEAKQLMLIGGGVGMTPLMSIARYLEELAWTGELVVIGVFRSLSEILFRDDFERLAKRQGV